MQRPDREPRHTEVAVVVAGLLGALALLVAAFFAVKILRALVKMAFVLAAFVLLGGLLVRYGSGVTELFDDGGEAAPAVSDGAHG